jgi:hypothetical protein
MLQRIDSGQGQKGPCERDIGEMSLSRKRRTPKDIPNPPEVWRSPPLVVIPYLRALTPRVSLTLNITNPSLLTLTVVIKFKEGCRGVSRGSR